MQACPTVAQCRRTQGRGKVLTKPSSTMPTPPSPAELPLRFSQHHHLTKLFCQVALAGTASLGQVEATIEHDTESAILTFKGDSDSSVQQKCFLAGPANVWFGVGFNAGAMADKPYAVIVDGAGKVIMAAAKTG